MKIENQAVIDRKHFNHLDHGAEQPAMIASFIPAKRILINTSINFHLSDIDNKDVDKFSVHLTLVLDSSTTTVYKSHDKNICSPKS